MTRPPSAPPERELGNLAMEAALQAGDHWAFVHAALWAGNCLDGGQTDVVVRHLRAARAVLDAAGAPLTYTSHLASAEAEALLDLGDWRACADLVRTVLGSASGPMSSTSARLTAARLALRQGRVAEAVSHLERAEEVFATTTGFLAFGFDVVRTELDLARGRTEDAVARVLDTLTTPGVAPTGVENLLPLAARALADQALAGGSSAADELVRLRERFPTVIPDVYPPGGQYDAQVAALQRVYDAETARGLASQSAGDWPSAAAACRDSGLRWLDAYCSWRTAEVAAHTRSGRHDALTALHRAEEIAGDLGALPLLAACSELATSLRTGFGLTAREGEVLELLVEGLTYRQIAERLFLSPKTVSVHVSNLLRKTGTTSRGEVADLVRLRRGV